jgi:hypothetical protein
MKMENGLVGLGTGSRFRESNLETLIVKVLHCSRMTVNPETMVCGAQEVSLISATGLRSDCGTNRPGMPY